MSYNLFLSRGAESLKYHKHEFSKIKPLRVCRANKVHSFLISISQTNRRLFAKLCK